MGLFRLLRRDGGDELKPKPVTHRGELTDRVRDPQYTPHSDSDGWLGDPPTGSPEYRAWQRWMSS